MSRFPTLPEVATYLERAGEGAMALAVERASERIKLLDESTLRLTEALHALRRKHEPQPGRWPDNHQPPAEASD